MAERGWGWGVLTAEDLELSNYWYFANGQPLQLLGCNQNPEGSRGFITGRLTSKIIEAGLKV